MRIFTSSFVRILCLFYLNFSVFCLDYYTISIFNFAVKHFLGKKVFHLGSYCTAERSCTINRVKTLFGEKLYCAFVYSCRNIVCLKSRFEVLKHYKGNFSNFFFGKLAEYNNIINTVKEFRSEHLFEFIHNAVSDVFIDSFTIVVS